MDAVTKTGMMAMPASITSTAYGAPIEGLKTTPSSKQAGSGLSPIVNHSASDYPPKRNGKRRHVASIHAGFRGAMPRRPPHAHAIQAAGTIPGR